jgi:hypothetical protein
MFNSNIPIEYERIAQAALKDAEECRVSAGYGGRYDDGGAGQLTAIVDAWTCGLRGEVPFALIKYQKQANKESDPDWQLYQQLQKKFEG